MGADTAGTDDRYGTDVHDIRALTATGPIATPSVRIRGDRGTRRVSTGAPEAKAS